jgi:hypothetical protein
MGTHLTPPGSQIHYYYIVVDGNWGSVPLNLADIVKCIPHWLKKVYQQCMAVYGCMVEDVKQVTAGVSGFWAK